MVFSKNILVKSRIRAPESGIQKSRSELAALIAAPVHLIGRIPYIFAYLSGYKSSINDKSKSLTGIKNRPTPSLSKIG